MIVSDRALRQISLEYKPQYLTADFARIVAGWCIAYQERYNRAPGPDIQILFESHRRDGLDEESARLISQFLTSISQEFERDDNFNEQLSIDEAKKYFRERALGLLRDDLDYWLQSGNTNQAHAAVAEWAAPGSNISMGFEPLNDKEGIREAFQNKEHLINLPGDLGKMLNPRLQRDSTWAIIGKFKSTKSFTSQAIGFHAMLSGLNVGWIDFEMGKNRIYKRICQAACAKPLRHPKEGAIMLPVWDCWHNQFGDCTRPERTCRVPLLGENGKRPRFKDAPRDYVPCDTCRNKVLETWLRKVTDYKLLDWRTAYAKAEALKGVSMGAVLKLQTWPKFSAGLADLKATLHVWRHLEGFVPDVLIVDQPSGMKLVGKGDPRHQIDDLWKGLCGIAPELHCLTILPSQAGGKDAQGRRRLRDFDVAEHAGIIGHVDGTIKIDQDDIDEEASRAWFSVGVDRDGGASDNYCCVLQALDYGQPVYDSRFK